MRYLKKIHLLFFLIYLWFATINYVHAQPPPIILPPVIIKEPRGTGGISDLLSPMANQIIDAILNVIFLIGTPVAVLMIVYSGFLLVTAKGNEQQLERGKKAFVGSLIGAAIITGIFVIYEIINFTLGAII